MGVQTGVRGFDSRTQHKSVVLKIFEADIWKSSYYHLTDVGGHRGGCQQLSINQHKPRQHQTFAIEKKFRDLIVATRSCPGEKKSL